MERLFPALLALALCVPACGSDALSSVAPEPTDEPADVPMGDLADDEVLLPAEPLPSEPVDPGPVDPVDPVDPVEPVDPITPPEPECREDSDCPATITSAAGRFKVECVAGECTPTESLAPIVSGAPIDPSLTNSWWYEGCSSSTAVCQTSLADNSPGNHFNLFLAPDQVGSILLPSIPRGQLATSQIIYSASPAYMTLAISRVPGEIDVDAPCSVTTTGYDASLTWAEPGSTNACAIDQADGPWYVNVLLDYTSVEESCPMASQPGYYPFNRCAVNILYWTN